MFGAQCWCTVPGPKLLNDCFSAMVVRLPTPISINFSSLFWVITHIELIGFQTPFVHKPYMKLSNPPKIYQETPHIHKSLTSRTQNLHYQIMGQNSRTSHKKFIRKSDDLFEEEKFYNYEKLT